MSYKESFTRLINELEDDDYIGLGNPNSKILFIGKEPGMPLNSELEHGCVKHWKSGINYSDRFDPIEDNIRKLGHTWQRYQKLYNSIATRIGNHKQQNSKYEITFVEDVFTTEFSQLPAPNSKLAKSHPEFKSQLEKRKESFFKSDFIREFQIVLIFNPDNDYIETYDGEVEHLFGVSFDKLLFENKTKIYINKGTTPNGKPKIVIHTWQLANFYGSIDSFIERLSQLVVEFLENNGISSLS